MRNAIDQIFNADAINVEIENQGRDKNLAPVKANLLSWLNPALSEKPQNAPKQKRWDSRQVLHVIRSLAGMN